MKICNDCDEKFSDKIAFCGLCGQPLGESVVLAPAEQGSDDSSPGIVMKILAAPALLLGAFLAIFLLITYYAAFVAMMLSFDLPIPVGIIGATVLLFGVLGGFVYLRTRDKSHS